VSQKNDTDVALYNFNLHQPILVILGRNFAERVYYRTVVSYRTLPYYCLCTTCRNTNPINGFQYNVSKTTVLQHAISLTFINQF